MHNKSLAIYIHWPFCKAKCPYCDFNSHVRREIDHERWLKAYITAIDNHADLMRSTPISSIFFGGGTPSLAKPEMINAILDKIASLATISPPVNPPSVDHLPMAPSAARVERTRYVDAMGLNTKSYPMEVTLEANPTSIEISNLKAFREAGINRLSIGIQSLRDDQLKFLGRQHSAGEAKNAIKVAAQYFDNYSFDLIYCLPNQTIEQWRQQLVEAISLAGPHLSLYQLTIEQGTVFAERYAKGQIKMPSEDESANFFEVTQEIMEKHGMPGYEISNHAKVGFKSRHNLQYWQYGDYLGIGPGAHGRIPNGVDKLACVDYKMPESWLKSVELVGHGIEFIEKIDEEQAMKEAIIMGLRLSEGMDLDRLHRVNMAEVDQLIADGLLIMKGCRIAATPRGKLLLNSIIDKLT